MSLSEQHYAFAGKTQEVLNRSVLRGIEDLMGTSEHLVGNQIFIYCPYNMNNILIAIEIAQTSFHAVSLK